jgi:hypothetical protein
MEAFVNINQFKGKLNAFSQEIEANHANSNEKLERLNTEFSKIQAQVELAKEEYENAKTELQRFDFFIQNSKDLDTVNCPYCYVRHNLESPLSSKSDKCNGTLTLNCTCGFGVTL